MPVEEKLGFCVDTAHSLRLRISWDDKVDSNRHYRLLREGYEDNLYCHGLGISHLAVLLGGAGASQATKDILHLRIVLSPKDHSVVRPRDHRQLRYP